MKVHYFDELTRIDQEFQVIQAGQATQVAIMVLQPGATSGEYGNEHPNSEQLLYVISGSGTANIEDMEVELNAGDAVFIDLEEKHQIKNTGDSPMRTLNVYGPPAY